MSRNIETQRPRPEGDQERDLQCVLALLRNNVPANDLGLCAVSLPVQHLDPSPAEQGGRAPLQDLHLPWLCLPSRGARNPTITWGGGLG